MVDTPGEDVAVDATLAADRRGRRASWIAAALFVLVIAGVRLGLGDRLARERYLTLREHEFRRNRFEIERILDTVTPGRPCPIVVWEVQGTTLEELEASPEWNAAPLTVEVVRDDGGPCTAADLLATLVETVRDRSADGDAGALRPRWRCDLISSTPVDPAGAVPAFVDGVHDDVPDVTSYLTEGDASWVGLETVRILERPADERRLVWARHTEPTPPHLAHARFGGGARASELSATAFYLERVREYLRRRGCERAAILIAVDGASGLGVGVLGPPGGLSAAGRVGISDVLERVIE